MEKNILSRVTSQLFDIENIRSCVDISERENILVQNTHIHELIIGLDSYDNFDKIIHTIQKDRDYILNSINEQIYIDIKYVEYRLFFEDQLLKIKIMENENLKSYLTNYKKFDILIDKDNIFSDYQVANIIENNWLVPNKDDFIEECVDFYLELVELALNYQESNTIGANMLKQSIIDKLIFMINSYMAIKYKNGVRLNQNAINYKTYLDREYYDQFQFILLSDGQENIWTIIFKSAQLFRSVALEVAREMEYSYPKKEDVKTMESLRNIYNGV